MRSRFAFKDVLQTSRCLFFLLLNRLHKLIKSLGGTFTLGLILFSLMVELEGFRLSLLDHLAEGGDFGEH